MDNAKNEQKKADAPVKGKLSATLAKWKLDKKKLHIALAVVLIIVVLIIYFSTLNLGGNKASADSDIISAEDYCEKMQNELADFLSSIKGAGKVRVLINFESSPELVIAYVVNESRNSNVGEDGKYTESVQSTYNPVILTQNGQQIPLILKTMYPKVTGVLVGATGADNVMVKLSLIDAVRTYLDINANSVQVYTLA